MTNKNAQCNPSSYLKFHKHLQNIPPYCDDHPHNKEMRCVILVDFICVSISFLFFGQSRRLIRISDFLSFFAYWARFITIGATQPEQHCCLGHAPASQSHVAHTQHCKKQMLFLQRKWRRALRFPNSNVHQTGPAPISDESAHNQKQKSKKSQKFLSGETVLQKIKRNRNTIRTLRI